MKILQTVHNLGTKSGGLASSVYNIVEALSFVGVDVTLAALSPAKGDKICGQSKEWLRILENDSRFGTLAYSKNFKHFLDETDFDIYHSNGNWGLHNYYTVKTAKRRGKPYIISTHGNFFPQALSISSWKKRIAEILWVDKDLNSANAICATSKQEMQYLREYGIKSPIAVVPNVILVPDFIYDIKKIQHSVGKYKFGFLGRLHPIKNLEEIIEAWAQSNAAYSASSLHIFGTGEKGYEEHLRELCKQLNLSNVCFEGWIDGRDKFEALANMTMILSPSKQENFGMTIAESLLVGTPVMASLNTPWEEIEKYNCGWWRPDSVEEITRTINEALSLSNNELIEMGKRGQKLIFESYSTEVVGEMMFQLYSWVLNPDLFPKPQFVYEI